MTDNVRAALAFVARGEARLGIVYATDAAAEPSVKSVATIFGETHPPITYPSVITAVSHNELAAQFLDFRKFRGARELQGPGLWRHSAIASAFAILRMTTTLVFAIASTPC